MEAATQWSIDWKLNACNISYYKKENKEKKYLLVQHYTDHTILFMSTSEFNLYLDQYNYIFLTNTCSTV